MYTQPALLGGTPVFAAPIPITRPLLPAFDQVADGVQDMLASGMLTKGSYLRQFEDAVAAHLGVRHAVAVSSCTTGLMLTYQALGLTGEVIVPSFTFMATVSALVWNGLRPVFVDVDPATTNMDADAATRAITPRTSAIVAVHNFGVPADIAALEALAARHGLPLIFDAAHGFGALYQGRPVGPQGRAQVFSLSPTKLLIAGEGGIVATNDDTLADAVRVGREYGNAGSYDSRFAGMNARLGEFNAYVGLRSLEMLEDAAQHRSHIAALFRRELGRLPGLSFQAIRPEDRSSYKDFAIAVEPEAFGLTRDTLALALEAEGVDTRKYYDPPCHRHTAYRQFAPPEGALPGTTLLAARSLSLPIWSHMSEAVAQDICAAVARIQQHAAAINAAVAVTP
jgi:dTDP-4-amino-4,6-dideoxygalactose transaminase